MSKHKEIFPLTGMEVDFGKTIVLDTLKHLATDGQADATSFLSGLEAFRRFNTYYFGVSTHLGVLSAGQHANSLDGKKVVTVFMAGAIAIAEMVRLRADRLGLPVPVINNTDLSNSNAREYRARPDWSRFYDQHLSPRAMGSAINVVQFEQIAVAMQERRLNIITRDEPQLSGFFKEYFYEEGEQTFANMKPQERVAFRGLSEAYTHFRFKSGYRKRS